LIQRVGVAVAGEGWSRWRGPWPAGGHEDGEEDEREEEFAVAAADGEGSEEGSVGDQGQVPSGRTSSNCQAWP